MTWSEFEIVRAIGLHVLQRKCLLLVDRCSWTGNECDVLGLTTDLRVIDVEVKISRADFKADAAKDKWWDRYISWDNRDLHTCLPEPQRWPRRVWKHYFAMPAEIWKPDLLEFLPSPACGVLVASRQSHNNVVAVRVMRRATPNRDAYRLSPDEVIDVARLANLRMWDAYQRIDRLKIDFAQELEHYRKAAA